MELTLLYIYVSLFLTVLAVFKLVDRKSNPFKKFYFWLAEFISAILLTVILGFIVLRAIGGPQPDEGLNQEFYPDGKLMSEFFIKNGKLEGLNKYWYSNGQLRFYSKYKNGQQIDSSISYLENGQIKIFEIYQNDKSIYQAVYYDNGQIMSEKNNPIDSLENNYQIDYYQNGNKKFQTKISNTTYSGEGIYYTENGKIEYKGEYKNGHKNGVWYKLDTANGKIIDRDTFNFNEERRFKESWK